MSQLFKTNLEEYARQCTLQRRHYEECLQAQQSCTVEMTETPTHVVAQGAEAEEPVEVAQLDNDIAERTQSCIIDLLEMPAEPLGWNNERSASGDARKVSGEEHQRYTDCAQAARRNSRSSTVKSPSLVSYSAP